MLETQVTLMQVRSRASSVSSHSNPLFTCDPDDLDGQVDIQSAALPTVPEALHESVRVFDTKVARYIRLQWRTRNWGLCNYTCVGCCFSHVLIQCRSSRHRVQRLWSACGALCWLAVVTTCTALSSICELYMQHIISHPPLSQRVCLLDAHCISNHIHTRQLAVSCRTQHRMCAKLHMPFHDILLLGMQECTDHTDVPTNSLCAHTLCVAPQGWCWPRCEEECGG